VPASFNLPDIVIGDDYVHQFEFQDENCDPLPQEGDFAAQIRKGGVLIADFTAEIDPINTHIVTISIPNSVTSTLVPTKLALWDLENDVAGIITTIVGGRVTIVAGITEPPGP
jgi:hypothetical protein